MFKALNFMIALSLTAFLPTSCVADTAPNAKIALEPKEAELRLSDFLSSCQEIAKSVSSKFVNPALAGKIVAIKGKKYEIRFFSFEDTKGTLPADMDFSTYVEKNNLLDMPSVSITPLPGISFESFDFRRANIGDDVYFSMALRPVE